MSGLTTFFQYFTALLGAFLAALWLALIFWTYRDIRSRTQDNLVQILAALLAAVMGPFGVLTYLILRPRLTIDQEYQHTLEEEALLSEIEEESTCPGCGSRTHVDWQLCPTCHTHLRKACDHCDRLMELSWPVCPYCGTPVEGVSTELQGAGT
ncbi:MAG: zinc ribbon domain-containing protein [Anaerolineales bacterium]|nr:zinc ribbon domain-containing protein [Anaerolineales bacterium]